ncbi:ABC transporter ATP-binding protein [Asanoa siamensis]|uniref:Macrolide ABC transporter ATP-binding protein n=1 Tax=Asanoa siamensis TaxID=926357 RepID=A0ABQ4CVB5_9ACTN|nr:ABC transporter ATP-binding protein [Asanoa siamensis]GIF75238.1 macrolide ABC transporter ATP-binding protein [Asanoa siamensis]
MSTVVEFVGVGRTYPGSPPVTALRPTDMIVHTGESVAITGRSGSGKSTILHLLGLLDDPSEGSYLLDGVDTRGLADRDRTRLRATRIGFVFQAFHLLGHRTALENVVIALLYHGVPRRDRAPRAAEALDRVGLAHRAHALPTTMSGGERQRVAIARALVTQPAVLLADEPTGNLDSTTADGVLALFDELHGQGQTIILVTHDQAVAARAHRRLRIHDGVVTEELTRAP